MGAGADQDFFEAADEIDCADVLAFGGRGASPAGGGVRRSILCGGGVATEVEDGVADDLAGAVEGDVATAVAFKELDAALGEEFRARDYVGGFRVTAECDDWFVFEKKEGVPNFAFSAEGD